MPKGKLPPPIEEIDEASERQGDPTSRQAARIQRRIRGCEAFRTQRFRNVADDWETHLHVPSEAANGMDSAREEAPARDQSCDRDLLVHADGVGVDRRTRVGRTVHVGADKRLCGVVRSLATRGEPALGVCRASASDDHAVGRTLRAGSCVSTLGRRRDARRGNLVELAGISLSGVQGVEVALQPGRRDDLSRLRRVGKRDCGLDKSWDGQGHQDDDPSKQCSFAFLTAHRCLLAGRYGRKNATAGRRRRSPTGRRCNSRCRLSSCRYTWCRTRRS